MSFINWKEVGKTVNLWNNVHKYGDSPNCNSFKELAAFAIYVLTLPHSNAEVTIKRIFSQLNLVKNKLRNRMETKMVNAILGILTGLKRHGRTCYNYEIKQEILRIIDTKQTKRRQHKWCNHVSRGSRGP